MLIAFLVLIASTMSQTGGASIESIELENCIELLTQSNVDVNGGAIEFPDECDSKIQMEIRAFYEEIEKSIDSGMNIENLENSEFVAHKNCIKNVLQKYNVTSLFFKGLVQQKLNKIHKSLHAFNSKMTSQQILILFALQLCEPQSFYPKNFERLITVDMKTTRAQSYCLLNHLNHGLDPENHYQMNVEHFDIIDDNKCEEIIKNFQQKYYYVIDRARSFSVFGLDPHLVMDCRAKHDTKLLENMFFLTIFAKLNLTSQQIEGERINFYDIAKESAKHFFECINLYD